MLWTCRRSMGCSGRRSGRNPLTANSQARLDLKEALVNLIRASSTLYLLLEWNIVNSGRYRNFVRKHQIQNIVSVHKHDLTPLGERLVFLRASFWTCLVISPPAIMKAWVNKRCLVCFGIKYLMAQRSSDDLIVDNPHTLEPFDLPAELSFFLSSLGYQAIEKMERRQAICSSQTSLP